MKLLILTQIVDLDDPLGFFHTWIERLAKRVDQVFVICLKEGRHALPSNVRVLSLGKEKKQSRLLYVCHFYWYIWRYRHTYDGVFIHMNPEYAILGGLFWRLWRKKILLWYVHKAVNARLWLAEKIVTKIFTASEESFRLPSKKVQIVGHGIPVDSFALCPPHELSLRKISLLSVGRIAPVKDLQTAILAVRELRTRYPGCQITLDIVGEPGLQQDTAYKIDLENLVDQHQLGQSVHFLGKQEHAQITMLYQQYDILVHTSKTGSLDKVVLEAMSAGMIVCSSNKAAQKNEVHGAVFSFPEGDSFGLASCIEKACMSGILLPNAEARGYVERHHSLTDRITDIHRYFSVI